MLRHLIIIIIVAAVILGPASLQAQTKHAAATTCPKHGSFPTQCDPFGGSSKTHPIDNSCGVAGDATDLGDQAQDEVKNNLCATGEGQEITISELTELQQKVDASGLKYGNRHRKNNTIPPPPKDREAHFAKGALGTPVGEKDLVSFVGYIVETKPGSPESVNCHCPGVQANDIHVALADHPLRLQKAPKNATAATKAKITKNNNASLCTNSVTAEILPHLRPTQMERSGLSPLIDKQIVLVTGQLFFDTSHHPCNGETPRPGDPARMTSWEIHPVYDIKICKRDKLAQCNGDVAADWTSLSQ
jgi:hypothetical protein